MALSAKRKKELALMTLPSDDEMRTRVESFLRSSGLSRSEMASLIGYSYSSLTLYLNDNYGSHHRTEGNTAEIRATLKEFMDLHEVQNSFYFSGTHHQTTAYLDVRTAALNALAKGTAYLLDGPPGTEKTWCLRQVEREVNCTGLGRAIYVYARVRHSPQSFLQEICAAACIPNKGGIDQLLRKLRYFLAKGRIVLIVDEAQHLDHAGLEVLRQLLDLPPHFGVILAGSHDLTQRLSHWQMEQWRSRLRKTLYLNGPSQQEARTILRAELGDMSDIDCDETIMSCRATAQRAQMVGGKQVNQPFTYISARDLFGAIERAKECLTKAGAA